MYIFTCIYICIYIYIVRDTEEEQSSKYILNSPFPSLLLAANSHLGWGCKEVHVHTCTCQRVCLYQNSPETASSFSFSFHTDSGNSTIALGVEILCRRKGTCASGCAEGNVIYASSWRRLYCAYCIHFCRVVKTQGTPYWHFFTGHFGQKSPGIIGSERDLQLEAPCNMASVHHMHGNLKRSPREKERKRPATLGTLRHPMHAKRPPKRGGEKETYNLRHPMHGKRPSKRQRKQETCNLRHPAT